MPGARIEDQKTCERLREQGERKKKSARIANAAAGRSRREVGAGGGTSPAYAHWSKQDLLKRAREIGIEGRSPMSKAQLIDALRNH
jgi:hypothetical protein